MQFDGEELRGILNQQSDLVAIHDYSGFSQGEALDPLLAIKCVDLNLYVGIGNRRRIRYLRALVDSTEQRKSIRSSLALDGRLGFKPRQHTHKGVEVWALHPEKARHAHCGGHKSIEALAVLRESRNTDTPSVELMTALEIEAARGERLPPAHAKRPSGSAGGYHVAP